MKEIFKLSLSIAIVGFVAGLALSATYSLTRDQIAHQHQKALFQAQKELFPEAESFESLEIEKVMIGSSWIESAFYARGPQKETLGYLVNVRTPGYGGMILFVIGFDLDEQVRGVQITDHKETPGLGANAAKKQYLQQFNDKSIHDSFIVKEDIKLITASTITTQSLAQGIRSSIEWINLLQKEASP